LRVDGGAAVNDLLMQMQADLAQVAVTRPMVTETTALGAAYLAGLGAGLWSDPGQIAGQWKAQRVFEPRMSADEAQAKRSDWSRAMRRASGWDT
jgi:glycerol kinase